MLENLLRRGNSLAEEEARLSELGSEILRLESRRVELTGKVQAAKAEEQRGREDRLLGDLSQKEYEVIVKDLDRYQKELENNAALLSGLGRKMEELREEISQRYLEELPKEIERLEREHIGFILTQKAEAIERHKKLTEWAGDIREEIRAQSISLRDRIHKLWKAQDAAGQNRSRFEKLQGLELGHETPLEDFLTSLRVKVWVKGN